MNDCEKWKISIRFDLEHIILIVYDIEIIHLDEYIS